MKRTTFQFEIRLLGENPVEQLERLRTGLVEIKGVEKVESQPAHSFATLLIHVKVADADSAQALHKKIMVRLMKTDAVRISRVTSNLSEVFG